MLDVVVIGGGPAGLQAALTLARGQRQVLVLDAGPPRNARATAVHTFLTRDGTPPAELRAHGRAELARYGVEVREARALAVEGEPGRFAVRLADGELLARRVLLAVGMVDVLPDLPGLPELWGDTVFQCPYCHGHEVRGQRWAVWVTAPPMLELAVLARGWTRDVVALTEGAPLDGATRARLARAGIAVDERRVAALLPGERPGRLGAIRFTEGPPLPRDALVFRPPQRQTALVEGLGLALDAAGYVVVDAQGQTSRPGVYAAGDLTTPAQSAIGGAGAALAAAASLNRALTAERLGW